MSIKSSFILKRYFAIILPRVFLKIKIEEKKVGELVFELRSDIVPKTAENFRMLCLGSRSKSQNGADRAYRGSRFHKIVPGLMAQGGDFTEGNGSGGESIYGFHFNDENFILKHDEPGIITMANSGPNTNGSQFIITFVPCPFLDGKNVAFGKLIRGWEVLSSMQAEGTKSGQVKSNVEIISSGQIEE
jgi:peptidylprolyl isomerase